MPPLLAALAAPAAAQFRPDPQVVGEDYHVEVAFNFWNATAEPIVNSEALGILGTDINLVDDLGLEQKVLKDWRVVLRPGTKHRLHIDYLPMNYDQPDGQVNREFIFNGLRYPVGLPVATTAQFKTWRFGYEYDFLYKPRGFLGVILDVKVTDVNVGLNSPIGDEFAKALAPIPTIGAAGRFYPAKNLALNGEFGYFRVPESVSDDYKGRYVDWDVNATFNASKNFGVQARVPEDRHLLQGAQRYRRAEVHRLVLRRHHPLLSRRAPLARAVVRPTGRVDAERRAAAVESLHGRRVLRATRKPSRARPPHERPPAPARCRPAAGSRRAVRQLAAPARRPRQRQAAERSPAATARCANPCRQAMVLATAPPWSRIAAARHPAGR